MLAGGEAWICLILMIVVEFFIVFMVQIRSVAGHVESISEVEIFHEIPIERGWVWSSGVIAVEIRCSG